MMKKLTYLLLLIALSLQAFGQKIAIKNLDPGQIPSQIKYEGRIKGAYQFIDSAGKHIVILAETGVYTPKIKNPDDFRNAKLFAYHYLENQGKISLTWKVYDAILDCGVDLKTNFVKDSFLVTDLNKDGNFEIWMVYKKSCRGDVSPDEMKIIMYQGKQKFAMRGETTVYFKDVKPYGGGYKFDEGFLNGPKAFSTYAKKIWDIYSIDKY